MTDTIFVWFRTRTARERILLVAAGLFSLAIFAWLAVLAPLGEAKAQAKLRLDAAAGMLGQARAGAAARQQAPADVPRAALAGPAGTLLSQAAQEAGFVDARIAATGPTSATVAVDAARPEAAFAWLHRLEAQGFRIVSLRTAVNADRTLCFEAALEGRGQ